MFFVLFIAAFSLRPVVLVPPLFGSQLYINSTNFKSHWYCPQNQENRIMWISEEYLIPPLFNCIAEYLSSEWDPSLNTVKNRTNVDVFTIDFGGEAAIGYVDSGILGYHFVADLVKLLEKLHDAGYETRRDLFGAPYDWRNAPHFIDHYYPMLQELIEQAYYQNDNQKVCVFSYSCGSMVLHYFLTKKVDQAWKDKFIHKAIWASPSFGGSMDAVRVGYSHTIEYLPSLYNTEAMSKLFQSTATLSAHLPNYNVFPEYPLVYGPNGETYNARQIQEWLKALGKVSDEYIPIFDAGKEIFAAELDDPGVNSYFAFNTALKSVKYLNFSHGYDKEPETEFTSGDETMQADVLYYGCNKWKSGDHGKTMLCHDFNNTSSDFSHVSILSTQEFVNVMLEIIQMDNWIVPGRHNVTGSQAPNLIDKL